MGKQIIPKSAKIAIGLQALIIFLILAVWITWASWGMLSLYHFILTGIFFFPAFALCTTSLYGLSKGKMSGWLTSIIGNIVSVAVLLFFAGPTAVFPAGLLVYLLLPPVRDYYVRDYYQ